VFLLSEHSIGRKDEAHLSQKWGAPHTRGVCEPRRQERVILHYELLAAADCGPIRQRVWHRSPTATNCFNSAEVNSLAHHLFCCQPVRFC